MPRITVANQGCRRHDNIWYVSLAVEWKEMGEQGKCELSRCFLLIHLLKVIKPSVSHTSQIFGIVGPATFLAKLFKSLHDLLA
jgi:hypothetical protein